MEFLTQDINYIAGFEAGCDFILNEIERYRENFDGAPNELLAELLLHLRTEKTPNV
jgi:hypothetical protein